MTRLYALVLLSLVLTLPALASSEEEEETPAAQPTYYELSPSLIANLPSGAKYIRCDVQLMTLDPERLPDIELHAPAIRHEMLMLLSEQDGTKLKTADGKKALLEQSLEAVRKLMRELTGKDSVDDVFFTAYFVQ